MGTTTAAVALIKTAVPTLALNFSASQAAHLTPTACNGFIETMSRGEFWANTFMQSLIALLTVGAAWYIYNLEQKSKKREDEQQAINLIEGLKTTFKNISTTVKAFNTAAISQGAVIQYDQISFFDNASLLAIADVKYHLLNMDTCSKIDLLSDRCKQANIWIELMFQRRTMTSGNADQIDVVTRIVKDRLVPLVKEIEELTLEAVMLNGSQLIAGGARKKVINTFGSGK
jgi:hypothetical protein